MKIAIHRTKNQVVWDVDQGTHMWNVKVVVDWFGLGVDSTLVLDEILPEHVLRVDRVLKDKLFPVERPYQIKVGNHRRC